MHFLQDVYGEDCMYFIPVRNFEVGWGPIFSDNFAKSSPLPASSKQ